MKKERYYTDKEFEELIEKLDAFISFCSTKNESDIDECINFFNANLKKILILPIVAWHDDLKLHHLRLNICPAEDIQSLVPFSYCPKTALEYISLGRLNLKGQAIFYTSTSQETCIKEMKIQVEKEPVNAYFSVWNTTAGKTFYSFIAFSPNVSKLSPGNIELEEVLINKLSYIGCKAGLEKYLRTLGQVMLGSSYIPSAILANHLFNNVYTTGIRIDCIIYPSVQENEIIYDYAFTPQAVDEFLAIEYVCAGTLCKEGEFKCKNGVIGLPEGNVINWYKPSIVPYDKVHFIGCRFSYVKETEEVDLDKVAAGRTILAWCNTNKELLSEMMKFDTEFVLSSLSIEDKQMRTEVPLKSDFELIVNNEKIANIQNLVLIIEYISSFSRIGRIELDNHLFPKQIATT